MTNEEKIKVQELRAAGLGYVAISKQLSISVNTVSSYCRSHLSITTPCVPITTTCVNCGKLIEQKPKLNPRRFCCDTCRNKWWGSHKELIKHSVLYEYVCPYCGKDFQTHDKRPRKYCSHQCYIKDRFGDLSYEERLELKNERRKKYQTAMDFANDLLEKNMINKEIYDSFDGVMCRK